MLLVLAAIPVIIGVAVKLTTNLSGYRMIQALRAEQNWVRVLVLSAKDGEYDEADALDLGADVYLIKPFSFVVLLARLRAVLRRGVRPGRRTWPAVTSAWTRRPARFAGARPNGADAAGVLAAGVPDAPGRRGGQQGRLLHHVWDAHYEGDANVIEVYVGYLRRKIDLPFERHAVQTVPGPATGWRTPMRRWAGKEVGSGAGAGAVHCGPGSRCWPPRCSAWRWRWPVWSCCSRWASAVEHAGFLGARTGAEVATLVQSGRLPKQVLAGSGGVSLVQVVDEDNRVWPHRPAPTPPCRC